MTIAAGSLTAAGLTSTETVAAAVTALFVPGDRPERFAKAAAAEAVNPQGFGHYDADIALLLPAARTQGSGLLGIVVPKAEDPAALGQLRADMAQHMALVPLIESRSGL